MSWLNSNVIIMTAAILLGSLVYEMNMTSIVDGRLEKDETSLKSALGTIIIPPQSLSRT